MASEFVKVLSKPELNKYLFQLRELLQDLPTAVPLGETQS